MENSRHIYLKIWLFSLPFAIFLLPLFTVELAIPGPITLSAQTVLIAAEPSFPPTPPLKLARSARVVNMDIILSNFRTGLKTTENKRLIDFIVQESIQYGFDPELILAVISIESSFYNWSVSKNGALGMMQIVPTTGRALAKAKQISWKNGKDVLFDPFLNISLGVQYLHSLTQKFPDIQTALTAYNFGPTRIRHWIRRGKKLPTGYANRILRSYESYLQYDTPSKNAT